MIRSILHSSAAIITSLVVAMALIIGLEVFSAAFYPLPEGVDIRTHVAEYPQWILAFAVVAWGATTFIATWIAIRLGTGRHPAHGIAIVSLLVVAAVFNMLMLPYPLWFEIANYALLPLSVFAGVKLARTPQEL